MDDWSQALPVIGILGGSTGFLTVLTSGIIKWKSGAAGRQRDKNRDIRSQRDEALAEAEYERDYRISVYEDYARLRRIARESGIPDSVIGKIPKKPNREEY